ncbi:MAG: hypothetical protein ABJA87_06960 [bacterium]
MEARGEIDDVGPALGAVTAQDDSSDPAGDPVVAEPLSRLDAIESRPLEDHVQIYEAVHSALQQRLAGTDGSGQPTVGGESAPVSPPDRS